MHHPFTSPAGDDLAPETAKARAYDLVLNGFEVGGGSIRIHDAATQRAVFDALQLAPRRDRGAVRASACARSPSVRRRTAASRWASTDS